MSLPTYEEAFSVIEGLVTDRKGANAFKLIGPWLDLNSLASCCRVTKQWNAIFTTHLWADPLKSTAQTSHPFITAMVVFYPFASSNPTPYAKKTRSSVSFLDFRKILKLRNQETHENDWHKVDYFFRGDAFTTSYLPLLGNLQFVVLDGLEGFEWLEENEEVMTTSNFATNELFKPTSTSDSRRPSDIGQPSETSLASPVESAEPKIQSPNWILFSAAGCCTLDGTRLLKYYSMRNLMFLDLSYTLRDENWSRHFIALEFPKLRVLKLAGLRLSDKMVPPILENFTDSLWSLDLSNNQLTDDVLHFLVTILMRAPTPDGAEEFKDTLEDCLEEPPQYLKYIHEQNEAFRRNDTPLRPDTSDDFIKYVNEHGHLAAPGQLFDENDPISKSTGLTHLYISGNNLSEQGVRFLITSKTLLQVLDVGSTVMESDLNKTSVLPIKVWCQNNTGKLLQRLTGTRLQSLRIHHSIATNTATITPKYNPVFYSPLHSARAELQGKKAKWVPFDPVSNRRIHTLTLTDIPTHSTGFIVDGLKDLLYSCTFQQTLLDDYRRLMAAPTRRSVPFLSGLRRLRLEFITPIPEATLEVSVSGDQDADVFLAESSGDFSFFGEDEEKEKVKDKGKGKKVSVQDEQHDDDEKPPLIDVLQAIKEYRNTSPVRWRGTIDIVFPSMHLS